MVKNCAIKLFLGCVLAQNGEAFSPNAAKSAKATKSNLFASNNIDGSEQRRSFLSKVVGGTAALSVSSVLRLPLLGGIIEPANAAFGNALAKANDKLKSYGLTQIAKVPDGFSPLVELYGKGSNRSPLLIKFFFPFDWVVTLPNNDMNGEQGTVQAGEYAKGDTATFFLLPDTKKIEKIGEQPKEFYTDTLIKAISQKGGNVYQNFKVTKVEPTEGEQNNEIYVICDFKYELLTGAGFIVERTGVASITSVGDGVQVLWTASIRARFKNKTENTLRTIVSSFRVYADGLEFSAERRPDMPLS
mmetsp:Transcript_2529/g.2925  ORF Transcript_2529/g.2925 Transcript_2529/m.2925 type:complete len:302 (+) Transcript_2529:47-952(+)